MEKWRPKLALDTEHLLAGVSDNSNRNPYTKSKLMKNVLLQVNTCRKISARRKQSKRQQSDVRRQMLTLKNHNKLWDVYTLTSKFLTGSLCRTVATNFHEICTEWINMMFHWRCTKNIDSKLASNSPLILIKHHQDEPPPTYTNY